MTRLRRAVVMAAVALTLGAAATAVARSAADGLFAEGNDLYRKGEFAAARQRYLAAAETGARDPRLFYNLGNACFKDGRLGEAVVWYERALRLAPRDEDARANLQFARRVKRDQEPEGADGLGSALYALYLWPTLNELVLAVTLCLVAGFAAASWRVVRGGGAACVAVLVLCASGAAGAGGWAGTRLHRHVQLQEAVLTVDEGTARSGPGARETPVFVVHEGTKVTVERQEGNWLLVRLGNGLGGWLPVSAVTVI